MEDRNRSCPELFHYLEICAGGGGGVLRCIQIRCSIINHGWKSIKIPFACRPDIGMYMYMGIWNDFRDEAFTQGQRFELIMKFLVSAFIGAKA